MSFLHQIRESDGYTLLETIVALALFLSVLIPLGTVAGNLMVSGNEGTLSPALQLAVREMTQYRIGENLESLTIIEKDLVLKKKVRYEENLIEIDIEVTTRAEPQRSILVLHRTLLSYR